MQTKPVDFDVIVIGSGIGGLTVASLLAQLAKMRVLVLERHFRLGGFTHSFSRPGGYTWDVGLHYVGGMAPGAQSRQLMDLVTGSAVDWQPLPEPFETFQYPGFTFEVPVGSRAYRDRLVERFPQERRAIDQYFRDVPRAAQWAAQRMTASAVPWFVSLGMRLGACSDALALSTTRQYLDAHFKAPELKALLASQWGDYGLPPSESAFAIHSLIVDHYFDGGWYPTGGAQEIARAAQHPIEAAGGCCLVGHTVDEILIRNGRAVGVRARTRRGEAEFHAPVIVSDAGAITTFEHLLPASVDLPLRAQLRALPRSHGVISLYLGLTHSPAALGLRGGNVWLYDGLDHDALFAERAHIVDGRVTGCYLSFPSLKDARAKAHTAEIITQVDYEVFETWRAQGWHQRDDAYQALKTRLSDTLLTFVNRHYPGFRDLVAQAELSTPLSVEHFTGHERGGIYGVPATPERFRQTWFKPQTPVPGLYLTGTDAGSLGIVGALMGGVATSAVLLGGAGFLNIMATARRARVHPPGS